VSKRRKNALTSELVERSAHLRPGLSRLDPPLPGSGGRRKAPERLRNLARGLVAELMARPAAARLQTSDPVRLALHGGRDAVPIRSGAGKLVLGGHFHQGKPVSRGIVLRRRTWIWRRDRGQVQWLARRRANR